MTAETNPSESEMSPSGGKVSVSDRHHSHHNHHNSSSNNSNNNNNNNNSINISISSGVNMTNTNSINHGINSSNTSSTTSTTTTVCRKLNSYSIDHILGMRGPKWSSRAEINVECADSATKGKKVKSFFVCINFFFNLSTLNTIVSLSTIEVSLF